MYKMMKRKWIQGEIRKWQDERDEELLKMAMIATWQAEETVQRGVGERDSTSVFLA
jgi:hypothetical protein